MSTSLSQLDPHDSNFAIDVVDRLVPIALQRGASDIHLQPRDSGWQVLLRIDGVLAEIARLRGGGPSDPVTRLMVLANLPTYRSTRPMEGRIRWETKPSQAASQGEVSMRLGVFPTVHGPRAVIRLLRRDSTFDSIDALGMSDDIRQTLYELSSATDGAILLSGPAGSGKTTTMYAMLRQIAASEPRRSVMTIEDPVESVIDSISQSELDPSAGMSLSSALRSAMRQDSEVLLVSEVRDPETAEAALQASLTGHLVFSSVHATDVPSALRRLVQLGIPHYVVRSGVRAIISQRLVRRLCSTCRGATRETQSLETQSLETQSHETQSRDAPSHETRPPAPELATGITGRCDTCLGSGYRGRLAIAQCVRFDGHDRVGEALGDALESGASVVQMRRVAVEAGGIDLRERGRVAAEQGWTDETEIYRVLGRPRDV